MRLNPGHAQGQQRSAPETVRDYLGVLGLRVLYAKFMDVPKPQKYVK